ncbi:hypothetical protein ETD86_30130 [Nonomuraea turkmeniaca]|uniref:Uncharacterized protein n=1 Tax=Nonomuraea turkmeniaca TaxID=103838 RepID=A0A5S4FA15_9ACTN|nr:hypothetical protein [Nonomuraea turkmeniaca]TMR13824.1 hypothetical protein ETD86_30130 [Nonomuraea turkmeniaca]
MMAQLPGTDTAVAMVQWAIAVTPVVAAVATLTYLIGVRVGRARQDREVKRLRARLATFTTVLAPLPAAMRSGRGGAFIPRDQLAVLALLVEHEGPDGEKLVELEQSLAAPPELPPNGHQK